MFYARTLTCFNVESYDTHVFVAEACVLTQGRSASWWQWGAQVLKLSHRAVFLRSLPTAWFWRDVEGGTTLTFLPSPVLAKKFAESQPRKDTPRKEKGSREEKQKPQPERKEEKKAAAPAPEEELDECEQALAAEPKAKDPFAHLPKR